MSIRDQERVGQPKKLNSPEILVCNSVDTLCLTLNLDRETQMYLLNLQFAHNLIPKGIYPTDSGIPRYKWGLEYDGIRVYYSDSEDLKPNCYIRFSSEYLQRVGYSKAYARCCLMLKSFGVRRPSRRLMLSQIDLAFDFQKDISTYLDNPEYHVKTRLQNTMSRNEADGRLVWRLWGVGGQTGYKVRVYDKLQEALSVAGKEYWPAIFESQGFDLNKPIWRIEYELRRDFLKQWKIDRFSQFLTAQKSIQKRLFDLWSIKVRDDSNISRCSNIPEFEYLYKHFSQDFIEHEVDRRPETFKKSSEQHLIRAINAVVGFISNEAACACAQDKVPGDILSFISYRLGVLHNKLKETVLNCPFDFLLHISELLQKKGYYFVPV